MLRKLLSHAAIYGLAAQLPRIAGILALPIITPHLTTTDYGVAGVVTAYVTALGMVQSLGLSVVMVNTFVKHPTRYKWVWRQLHGFVSLWSVVYGALVITVLFFAVPQEAAADRWLIALLQGIPVILFNGVELQSNFFYQMEQRPLPTAWRALTVSGLNVLLNIYTIAVLQLGYMGWFYSSFIALSAGFGINIYQMYWRQKLYPIFNFKWYRIKSALKVSLPVVPHQLSFFLLDTSDRLVLDWLRVPVPHIGLYNVASNFGSYFMAATGAVVQAASPFYIRFYAKGSNLSEALKVRHLTFTLQILFFVATSVLALWMKELFVLLIRNDELQQAYILAVVILMGCNYRPMYLAAINLISYRGHTSSLWKVSTVAGVANLMLNLCLVPVWGFEVAAFTTFAALMYTGYSGYFLKEYKQAAQVQLYPLVWLCLTVLLLLLVYFFADAAPLFKFTLSLAVVAVGGASLAMLQKNSKKA